MTRQVTLGNGIVIQINWAGMLTVPSRGMTFTVTKLVIWSISGTRLYDTSLSLELVVHHSVSRVTSSISGPTRLVTFPLRLDLSETGY